MMAQMFPWLIVVGLSLLAAHSILLRRQNENEVKRLQAQLGELVNDLYATHHGVSGMGKRIIGLEKYYSQMENRLEEMVRNDPNRVSYSEASKLVELGAEVEDLMNSCGISRPEAELVSALSRKQMAQKQSLN
ncbi:MAG: DUF2802 domain-containing protein [Hahellaceae bacterium]|nr:DUF2802 domain-containing protein [Hahellaceae bacterium]